MYGWLGTFYGEPEIEQGQNILAKWKTTNPNGAAREARRPIGDATGGGSHFVRILTDLKLPEFELKLPYVDIAS